MRRVLAMVAALAGCDPPAPADGPTCDAIVTPRAAAADRRVLGVGAPYPADASLRGQAEALAGSKRLRREAAWRTVEKLLAPAAVAPAEGTSSPANLPRFQTWYGRDDLSRLFDRLYVGLGAAGRAARASFAVPALDEAFGWNARAVLELPTWSEERWKAYRAAMDSQAKLAGAGGIGRVGYSPSAARHLLASYPELLQCLAAGAPADFVDGPGEAERSLDRRQVDLPPCQARTFGPYFVAAGETLQASLPGATVTVSGPTRCASRDGCEVTGPGRFEVSVQSGVEALGGALSVAYRAPRPAWAACLVGGFPGDAVVVKADWRRVLPGMPLAVHDTSARGLAAHVTGDLVWGDGEGSADPGPDEAYTLELPGGQVYRLAALHIMSKELDHWQWTTLWWSTTPDQDFGADRPATITGAFAKYKMCTVTSFEERDPEADGGYAGSLGEALAAVHAPEAWCSNPYLEVGAGNAATSCIGCHQHAGAGLDAETILADEQRFPAHARRQVRNNFPADYSFAVEHGDGLTRLFADVVAYWDAATR